MTENRVRSRREQLGLTQSGLAVEIGVSRQSLNAVEAGRAVPSVAIALRLARALGSDVESLFAGTVAECVDAVLVGSAEDKRSRVLLGSVRERWVAHVLSGAQFVPSQYAADGFVRALPGRKPRAARGPGRPDEGAPALARVELTRSAAELRETLLIGGCAPGLGVLCDRLNSLRGPGKFRWLSQSNMVALRDLSRGHTHVAGVHMPDAPRKPAARTLARYLPTKHASLIALASWEVGLVLPAGNPRRVRNAAQLVDPRLRLALREEGSGARTQFARLLTLEGLTLEQLAQRAVAVSSHMEVAQAVHLGSADVGFAIRGVALALGLAFVPLMDERFDLLVPDDVSADPRMLRLLDTLASGSFRAELEQLGYEAGVSAQKVGELDVE